MRKVASILPVAALAAVLISLPVMGTGCQKLQARDQLNKGVAAFKNAQYPESVEHFKSAVELDPNFPTARLYLAMAYLQQYIPGANSEENDQYAKAAYDQFSEVLKLDPNNTIAIQSIASLYLYQKKWPQERRWILQPGFYRLVGVVSGVREGPRPARHEARRSRAHQGQEGQRRAEG